MKSDIEHLSDNETKVQFKNARETCTFFRLISATGDLVNLSGEEAAFHLHNNANITRTQEATIKLKQLKLTKVVIPELKVW